MKHVQDEPSDVRSFRFFIVVDDYNGDGRGNEVDLSLPSSHVVRGLQQISEWRGKLAAIRYGNGPSKTAVH